MNVRMHSYPHPSQLLYKDAPKNSNAFTNIFVSNSSGTVRCYNSRPDLKHKSQNQRPRTPSIPNTWQHQFKLASKNRSSQRSNNLITKTEYRQHRNNSKIKSATTRTSRSKDREGFIKHIKGIAAELSNLMKLTSYVGEALNNEIAQLDLNNPRVKYAIGNVSIRYDSQRPNYKCLKGKLAKKRATLSHALNEKRAANSSCGAY